MTDKKLLNRSEAAHYLGLVEHTLAVWACHKTHDIPFIKIGRNVRYRISDLDAWLESRTINKKEGTQTAVPPSTQEASNED